MRFILSVSLLFLSVCAVPAQSNSIATVQADFVSVQIRGSHTAQSSGRIVYSRNPFYFAICTESPAPHTRYVNADGAFMQEGGTVRDISMDASDLRRSCTEFLACFKDDFGLRERHFAPAACAVQGNQIHSRWQADGMEAQVIMNERGQIESLRLLSAEQTLLKELRLSGYAARGIFSYPTQIARTDCAQGTETVLRLQNVVFNQIVPQHTATRADTDLNVPHKAQYARPELPDTKNKYRVSIPSVAAGAAFSFYKKFITNQDASACPYEPTCSRYMLQAVSQNGALGPVQGMERFMRCTVAEHSRDLYLTTANGKHYDPVPAKE